MKPACALRTLTVAGTVTLLAWGSAVTVAAQPTGTSVRDAALLRRRPRPVGRAETPAAMCTRLLARFGDAARAEQSDCVRAATVGDDRRACAAAGHERDFDSCFASCLGSVAIAPADYSVGDAVSNCEGPCRQTSCGESGGGH